MKRISYFLLVAVMLVSSCICVNADEITDFGAKHTEEIVHGAVSDVDAKVNYIEFNPADGLVPLAYSGNGGNVATADVHVDAAIAEGYNVVGAINGSFFEMATGAPCGTLISNGKLVFTHSGLRESVATFDSDGKLNVVSSALALDISINGMNYSGAIGVVNKVYAASLLPQKDVDGNIHYYDIDAGNIADDTVKGYEILCEKLEDSDLAVGKTLKGKVLELKEGSTYGATKVTDENQFVLFVGESSMYFKRASIIKVDDTIDITVTETNTSAVSAMENATTGISSAYWLVKGGVDITDTTATIIHDTSLARAWTAFGVKADGSYVYFVSEEYGLTLKDVADKMIELGCTDVVRLDGGGSTSMYVSGKDFVMSSERAVCDVLLVVKTESDSDEVLDGTSQDDMLVGDENASSESEQETPTESNTDEEGSNQSSITGIYVYLAICGVLLPILVIVFMVFKRKK